MSEIRPWPGTQHEMHGHLHSRHGVTTERLLRMSWAERKALHEGDHARPGVQHTHGDVGSVERGDFIRHLTNFHRMDEPSGEGISLDYLKEWHDRDHLQQGDDNLGHTVGNISGDRGWLEANAQARWLTDLFAESWAHNRDFLEALEYFCARAKKFRYEKDLGDLVSFTFDREGATLKFTKTTVEEIATLPKDS